MPTLTHRYIARVDWSGGRDGQGETIAQTSGYTFPLRVPTEFQGPGGEGATNPEELFTNAMASCYAITFGIVAANRRLPVRAVRVEAEGELEQNGASFRYASLTIRPTIETEEEVDDAKVAEIRDYAIKTDSYCIVLNAVRQSVRITVEPRVVQPAYV